MPWAMVDDQFHAHRKARKAWRGAPRALGLHLLAISYCAGTLTDGHVDVEFVEEKIPNARERNATVDALVAAGLWEVADDGWMIHDWLEFNQSRRDVERTREWDRRRKSLHRDHELVEAIRTRDEDRCRYCGVLVNWKDRRSDVGGTYDHVIPRGPNALDNVVVACRGCNTRKGGRTPEQASMPLLSPGQFRSRSELDRETDRTKSPAGARGGDGLGGDGNGTTPSKEKRGSSARIDGKVDQLVPPRELPTEIADRLDPVLAILSGVQAERGGHVPTPRGVGLALVAFPRHDHLAVARELQHWALAGRGQRKPVKDWVATYRTFLGNNPEGDPVTTLAGRLGQGQPMANAGDPSRFSRLQPKTGGIAA